MGLIGLVALLLGAFVMNAGFLYRVGFTGSEGLLVRVGGGEDLEGFSDSRSCNKCGMSRPKCGCKKSCNTCGKPKPKCGCSSGSEDTYGLGSSSGSGGLRGSRGSAGLVPPCPRVMEPDLSKYILKSQIPSCNRSSSDMSNYMLKTECPPVPDLSKYILKSSIPKPQPVIIDNSKCKTESGECPPCPRPRCPVVKCPPATKCPPPAPCPRPVCPPTVVKCKSEESSQPTVRPFLAPLNMQSFGSA